MRSLGDGDAMVKLILFTDVSLLKWLYKDKKPLKVPKRKQKMHFFGFAWAIGAVLDIFTSRITTQTSYEGIV